MIGNMPPKLQRKLRDVHDLDLADLQLIIDLDPLAAQDKLLTDGRIGEMSIKSTERDVG